MDLRAMDSMVAQLHATADAAAGRASAASENPVAAFGAALKAALTQVSGQEEQGDQMEEDYSLGADIPLHEVMAAGQLADIGLKQLVRVRNVAVEAYKTVSEMPV